jgi:hypothetical protein
MSAREVVTAEDVQRLLDEACAKTGYRILAPGDPRALSTEAGEG